MSQKWLTIEIEIKKNKCKQKDTIKRNDKKIEPKHVCIKNKRKTIFILTHSIKKKLFMQQTTRKKICLHRQ